MWPMNLGDDVCTDFATMLSSKNSASSDTKLGFSGTLLLKKCASRSWNE